MSNDGFEVLITQQIQAVIKEIDKEFPNSDKGLLAQEALHSAINYLRRKE